MKTDFKTLKVGDKLSETQYYTVTKKKGNQVQLQNSLEQDVVVDEGYVQDCLTSADQFETETKLNKTEMAELYLKSTNVALTVSFNKQVKQADVVKEIMDAYEGSTPKTIEAAVKKAVKRGLEGEERVLVGYHSGLQDNFGRVQTIDMNIPKGEHNVRLVDPREINYLIVRGTKYIVK